MNQYPRIRRAIRTWERDQRARGAVSSARDGQLGTGEIELSGAYVTRAVQGDVLDAEQVVAVGKRGGECGVQDVVVYCSI